MRLTDFEANTIKQSACEVFGAKTQVFLFGSRTDDTKKGGDIDLYIKAETGKDLSTKLSFYCYLSKK